MHFFMCPFCPLRGPHCPEILARMVAAFLLKLLQRATPVLLPVASLTGEADKDEPNPSNPLTGNALEENQVSDSAV